MRHFFAICRPILPPAEKMIPAHIAASCTSGTPCLCSPAGRHTCTMRARGRWNQRALAIIRCYVYTSWHSVTSFSLRTALRVEWSLACLCALFTSMVCVNPGLLSTGRDLLPTAWAGRSIPTFSRIRTREASTPADVRSGAHQYSSQKRDGWVQRDRTRSHRPGSDERPDRVPAEWTVSARVSCAQSANAPRDHGQGN
jgi:hypothetical protein